MLLGVLSAKREMNRGVPTFLVVMAGMVTVAYAGPERGTAAWYAMPNQGLESAVRSEVEAALYRIDISPTEPDTGIASGCVIAYGRAIAPPYEYVVIRDTLYLNGVRVYPAIRNESWYAAQKVGLHSFSVKIERHPSDNAYMDPIVLSLLDLVKRYGDRPLPNGWAVRDSVRAILREYELIDTLRTSISLQKLDEPVGFTEVTLWMKRHADGDSGGFAGPSVWMEFDRKQVQPASESAEVSRIAEIERGFDIDVLRKGRCLMYGAAASICNVSDHARAWSFLAQDTVTWSAKLQRLRSLGLSWRGAKEVLYNFRASDTIAFSGRRR